MKPGIRVFPLNSDYIAVSATLTEPSTTKQNLTLTTASLSNNLTFHGSSKLYQSTFIPQILDNGYFFTEQNQDRGDSTVIRYAIQNLLTADSSSESIEEQELDISMIATLLYKTSQHLLVGVSKNREELFLYTLVPSRSICHHVASGRSRPKEAYELSRENEQGITIFKTHHAQIVSLAGFPNLPNPSLAIATSAGEILLAQLRDDRTLETTVLQSADKEPKDKLQLFSTGGGLLIAYNSTKNTLRTWDIGNNNNVLGPAFLCPKMHNLSMSVDGNYLTAIDGEKESSHVHVFSLKPFKHHSIKINSPIEDFAIGKEGQVCYAQYVAPEAQASTSNSLFSLLQSIQGVFDSGCQRVYPGFIDQLLPVVEEQCEARQEKGLLSKLSSLFKPHKKSCNTLYLKDDDPQFLDATP